MNQKIFKIGDEVYIDRGHLLNRIFGTIISIEENNQLVIQDKIYPEIKYRPQYSKVRKLNI